MVGDPVAAVAVGGGGKTVVTVGLGADDPVEIGAPTATARPLRECMLKLTDMPSLVATATTRLINANVARCAQVPRLIFFLLFQPYTTQHTVTIRPTVPTTTPQGVCPLNSSATESPSAKKPSGTPTFILLPGFPVLGPSGVSCLSPGPSSRASMTSVVPRS